MGPSVESWVKSGAGRPSLTRHGTGGDRDVQPRQAERAQLSADMGALSEVNWWAQSDEDLLASRRNRLPVDGLRRQDSGVHRPVGHDFIAHGVEVLLAARKRLLGDGALH